MRTGGVEARRVPDFQAPHRRARALEATLRHVERARRLPNQRVAAARPRLRRRRVAKVQPREPERRVGLRGCDEAVAGYVKHARAWRAERR